MASILRSSKIVRYFASFGRNIAIASSRVTENNFLQQSQAISGLTPCYSTAIPKSDQNLDRSLQRLDQDVRRAGRISRRDIEEVMEEIRQQRSATSSQSLLVIRCCGNLVPEELPEVRTALVQEIWKTLKNLNVPMDISHYNALLRVYLENEHSFSPTEFLADIEAKGVEPNRVTYQRLISRYCQGGDIEGATRILEFMREKQLPVNEHVFNALIMGHSQAEDMESAVGILSVMKQAGLEPTADSYTTLLCGYAKIGEIDPILSTLLNCEQNEIYLLDRDILDIIYTMTTSGHSDKIDPLISRLRKSSGYNQDAINVILRLINKGEDDVAFKLLNTLVRSSRDDGIVTDTGNFFIRQLIRAKRPIETILSICKQLQDTGLNNRAFLTAVENSINSGSLEYAMPLLKQLKDTGFPIRHHYFWPLICSEAKKGTDAVLNVLQKMQSEFDLVPNSETIRDYVIPNLNEVNYDKMILILKSSGISVAQSSVSLVYYLLTVNLIKEASAVATSFGAYFSPHLLKRPLINALTNTMDFDSYIKILRQIHDSLPRLETMRQQQQQQHQQQQDGQLDETENISSDKMTHQTDVLGDLVFETLCNFRNNRTQNIKTILNGLIEQGLSISNVYAEKIQENLGSELTTEISTLLGKLTSGDLVPLQLNKTAQRGFDPSDMTIAQIENLIVQQKDKGENTKGLKRVLLTACFRDKNVEKVEEVIELLENEKYILTSGVFAQLIDLYCHHEQIEKCLEIYNNIRTKEPDFILDDYKTIRLVSLYVSKGQFDEAVKFMETNATTDKQSESRSFNYNAILWRLLNSLAENGKAEELQFIFDNLIKYNLLEPNNVLLGPLVKVHLINDDLPKAVEQFEKICHQYKVTPWKNDLACKLIQVEDAVNLQRLTDLSTNIHGEVNSLYDLVFSFVECGRIRQARKILETPGLRTRQQRINLACERYQQEGMVESLEGLIEATKDINHINRSDIYYSLLLSYIKDDQPEKGLGLWTKMQEEDIPATDQFLFKLGEFLQLKNLPLPFSMPINIEKKQNFSSSSTNENITIESKRNKRIGGTINLIKNDVVPKDKNDDTSSFRRLIKDGKLDEALQYKTLNNLSNPSISSLIEALIQSQRLNEATKLVIEILEKQAVPLHRVFRFYLNKLAETGDIKAFETIEKYLNSEMKKLFSFDNRYCHAFNKAGKTDEYLDKLETNIDNANSEAELLEASDKFPRGGCIGILESNDKYAEKYKKIAEKYAAKNILGPINILWIHYFINGHDDADKIWNEYLANTPRIMFQRIIETSRQKKNEHLIKKLINLLKTDTKITEGAIGIAYSSLIDILASKEDYVNGLAVIDDAIKVVCLENINRTALMRIKIGIEKAGKQFPFEIPEKRINTKGEESSSSSSSSSSSDDEPPPLK